MARAEKISLSGLPTETPVVGNRALSAEFDPLRPAEAPAEGSPRWYVGASLALQVGLIATLTLGFYRLVPRAQGLIRAEENQALQTQALKVQVEGLTTETNALKAEVVNLRQSLASGSTEDILFLKAIILKPDIDPALARVVAQNVHRYSALYGKDADLVLALIAVESGFNPKAVSPVGAQGLMQVMPHWKKLLAINGDLLDPETSIRYGLQVLGFYEGMYKDLDVVLTAYNRGPGPVDNALMRGLSPQNGYAPKVLQTYERIKKLNVQSAGR